jgi:hypothetical protein
MFKKDKCNRSARLQALVATALVMTMSQVCADAPSPNYPTDDRLRIFETTLQENVRTCMERPSTQALCTAVYKQRLQRQYPMRGTRQYFHDYYLPMTTPQLIALRDQLQDQQHRARSQRNFWIDNPRPPGELTQEMLGNELVLVDQELQKRQHQSTQSIQALQRDLKRIIK